MGDSDDDDRSLVMRKFTNLGDDALNFDTWFTCFNIRCDAFGIPEEPRDADGNILSKPNQRRCLFLLSLGPKVLRSLRGRCYPDDAGTLPLPKLAEKMMEMYHPSNTLICRYEFNCRYQREDETGRDYGLALMDLARLCNFGEFHNEALRDRFICGLRDGDLRTILLMKKDLDFDEAWGIVRSNEEFKECLESMRACSKCGRKHDKGKCPAQHWKCRRCKQLGHGTQFCQS